MMAFAKRPLSRIPGLSFWKLCGSGGEEGFTPRIKIDVFAILCVWPDQETAERQTRDAPILKRYRAKASEDWTVFLTPVSTRGAWSGVSPFTPSKPDPVGPVAALTRATIKPSIMTRFWKRVPDISQVIGADPNVAFKIGIGEVPLFQQVTFSIWPDADTMAEFARTPDGPHAKAIEAVREGKWFREELYARFRILGESGSWNGRSPLAGLIQE